MKRFYARLQQLGRALMLPIAVLPIAGLLLRLGQPDLLGVPMLAAAGEAVFSNLGLLFAIGVAVGLARENHGAAGLASVVGYLVATQGAAVLIDVPPEALDAFAGQARELAAAAYKARELAKLSVPAGILSGLMAGALYNRYSDLRLPSYLSFFGGRRFIPIASGLAGVALAAAFGYGWPLLERGMDALSHTVLDSGKLGLFAYGVLNRFLIVTGLHHIINNIAWFLLGDYGGVTGDLKRFFAGDPSAGAFMSGFFPVMMFGLPAACLAMYQEAPRDRRRAVGGLLASMALTSFLTGVTEPIEFTFMFLAPLLYALHAVLTGIAMVVADFMQMRLGFSFSAGLFDYVINYGQATRPWLLLPLGLGYSAIYYAAFRYAIRRFALPTPGRAPDTPDAATPIPESGRADALVVALGGARNLLEVDACTTRLRLVVADPSAVDESALRGLDVRGIVRPSANALQVVLGPVADQVAGEIRHVMRSGTAPGESRAAAQLDGREGASGAPGFTELASRTLAALGGRGNVAALEIASTRVLVTVVDDARVDMPALDQSGLRGVARTSPQHLQLVVGPGAAGLLQALREMIDAAR